MYPNAIYGGIIGDMVGSIYEWKPCLKDKVMTFPLWKGFPFLFGKHESQRTGSRYTDDTVCGLAIADAMMHIQDFSNEDEVKTACIKSLKTICPKYEWAGFGNQFWIWVSSPMERSQPYNSWGNGSAMRVFPVGMLFDNIEDTRRVARWTAEITHNHIDGIKGAECTASAAFLSRAGESKESTRIYLSEHFGKNTVFSYDFDRKLDDIRPKYGFYGNCLQSVPESILCFLEGNNFEECIRLAVSLGGDNDTMGCICGGIASMAYPIPESMLKQARMRLPKELRDIAERFTAFAENRQIS